MPAGFYLYSFPARAVLFVSVPVRRVPYIALLIGVELYEQSESQRSVTTVLRSAMCLLQQGPEPCIKSPDPRTYEKNCTHDSSGILSKSTEPPDRETGWCRTVIHYLQDRGEDEVGLC